MVNWCSSSFPCRVDPSEAQEDDPSLLSAVQKKGIKSRIPWPMAPVICVFIAYKSPTKPLWILWFLGGRIHPVNPPLNGEWDLRPGLPGRNSSTIWTSSRDCRGITTNKHFFWVMAANSQFYGTFWHFMGALTSTEDTTWHNWLVLRLNAVKSFNPKTHHHTI